MGNVHCLRVSAAQRALARFRDEERAFRLVLEVLRTRRRRRLFLEVLGAYRDRMRILHRLAGSLLDGAEPPSAAEELRRFARERDP